MNLSDAQYRDALPAGTVLNGYRVLGVLGRGGFGITYRATDLLDQSFAIKEFFPRQFATRVGTGVVATSDSDQDVFINCRERFLQEARLLASLGRNGGTPGVVRVITFFEANETAYSVMELLTGETLDEVLRTAPDHALPADKLEVVLRGILEPLRTVHAAGFLHRDIKPSNVLIGADGQPVLIDFGSARFWGPSSNTTQTQIYSGHYAPVEQMMQGTAQGPYSDIYAVGGVAYRAIGGSLVDARIRQQAVLSRQPDPLVPAVEVGRGRYPHDVLQAIDRALAVSAENRPQRAEDLLNLLDDDRTINRKTLFAADGPSWSHDSGPPRRIPERDERRRPRLLAQGLLAARRPGLWQRGRASLVLPIVATVAALVIGAALYFAIHGRTQPQEALAKLHVAVARNGSQVVVRFPPSTDAGMLAGALPYLARLNVTMLDLSNSQVKALPSLHALKSLQWLDLHGSEVTTLASLDGLASLRRLDLSDTKITTLPPLDDLVALQELNLSGSSVAGLPSLRKLTALKVLNLSDTGITRLPAAAAPAPLPAPLAPSIPPSEVPPVAFPADPPPPEPPAREPEVALAPLPLLPTAAPPVASRPPPEPYRPPEPPRARGQVPPSTSPGDAMAAARPIPLPPRAPAPPGAQSPPAASLPAPASAPRQSEDNQPAPSGQEYFQRGYAAYAMQHYDEARSLYLQGAAKGDANSMYSLGKLYAEGAGVSRNFTEAQSWYEKSAEKGNATALYSIGLLYLQDAPGRRRDCAAARQWLAKAAEHGSIAAQKLLTSDQSCS